MKDVHKPQPKISFSGIMEEVSRISLGKSEVKNPGTEQYTVINSTIELNDGTKLKLGIAEMYLFTSKVRILSEDKTTGELIPFEDHLSSLLKEALKEGETLDEDKVLDTDDLNMSEIEVLTVAPMEELNKVSQKRNGRPKVAVNVPLCPRMEYFPKFGASQYNDYLQEEKAAGSHDKINWNRVFNSGLATDAEPRKQLIIQFK